MSKQSQFFLNLLKDGAANRIMMAQLFGIEIDIKDFCNEPEDATTIYEVQPDGTMIGHIENGIDGNMNEALMEMNLIPEVIASAPKPEDIQGMLEDGALIQLVELT